MSIKATPNLNGNSHDDFWNAGMRLYKVANAMRNALIDVQCDVFHGRNYQTVEDPVSSAYARDEDMMRLRGLQAETRNLERLAQDIMAKGIKE